MKKTLVVLGVSALVATMAMAGPSIVGDMNGWNPADPAMNLLPDVSGVWVLDFPALAGQNYKAVDGDAWGMDFPGNNQVVNVAGMTHFVVNLGANVGIKEGDEFVTHMNPVVAGDFLNTLGGIDWDPSELMGEMTDGDGDYIYDLTLIIPAGNYLCKVTLNHNWDQNTSAANIGFASDGVAPTTFTYDMSTNTTTISSQTGLAQDVMVTFSVDMNCVDLDPAGAFLAGGFNGWTDGGMSDPEFDGIWTTSVQFYAGDAYDWGYKFKNGPAGWEDDPNRQLTIDDSMPIMVLPIVLFNDEDCTPTNIEIPEAMTLAQNYPNPFNPTTEITFSLTEPGDIQLVVYDLNGERVQMLAAGNHAVGYHTVTFDGANLASGVYIYTLSQGSVTLSEKMLLVK